MIAATDFSTGDSLNFGEPPERVQSLIHVGDSPFALENDHRFINYHYAESIRIIVRITKSNGYYYLMILISNY